MTKPTPNDAPPRDGQAPDSAGSSGDLNADRRYAWAMAALDERIPGEAAELLEQVLDLVPGWAPAWLALGQARTQAGRRDPAIDALRRCLVLDPADRLGAGVRLARLGASDAGASISPSYVTALFDAYAPRFEQHLTVDLAYRGPELIMAALDDAAPGATFHRAVDLGCGTGLMGAAIRSRCGWLAGCDLSPAMVALTRGKGVYDAAEVADAGAMLALLPEGSVDLVTAADMLVYVGDCLPIFAGVARVLEPGGLFAFTTLTLPDGDPAWQAGEGPVVGEDLCFRHAAGYLRRVAARCGLDTMHIGSASSRNQKGVPLLGLVGVARRG